MPIYTHRNRVSQTGLGSTGGLSYEEPPLQMQMGPQRAVAGVGTSKSDVGSGKGILDTCFSY